MTERFNRAYNILVDAFFNGTLAAGHCTCCAVGNLIAACNGEKVSITWHSKGASLASSFPHAGDWSLFFVTTRGIQTRRSVGDLRKATIIPIVDNALSLMENTGYTVDELAQIEYVFEKNTHIHLYEYSVRSEQEILEDQYNGLCAVFDLLCKLDEIEGVDYKAKLQEKEGLVLA